MQKQTHPLNLKEFPPSSYEEWRKAAEESLKGAPFEKKLVTKTHEGINLQPIYHQGDLEAADSSWPGLAPFLRGTRPGARGSDPWLIAQELPYGDPSAFNRAAKEDLMKGQNALQLLLDLPSRQGISPKNANPADVGQCGLSIDSLQDLQVALEGIHLEALPLLAWSGASSLPLLSAIAALAQERKIAFSDLQGGILADPIGEWAASGKLNFSLADAIAQMKETISWADETGCPLRTIGVNGTIWSDAGANAVQELAFSLSTAVYYLRELGNSDVPVDRVVPRVLFGFSLGTDLFMQIAKLRAARLLWWKAVDAFGGKNGAAFIHARSTLINKSTLDPHTNMLRATAEAFAGVVGGADSMHVACFDEPLRAPDTFSRRVARNIHIILGEECELANPVDPAGGSWFVETLTHQLAEKAWQLFQEVEGKGGMPEALCGGLPQKAIAATAEARLTAVATRRDGLIGVNLFPNSAEKPLAPSAEQAKKEASSSSAASSASPCAPIADVPAAISAWKSGSTLSEIAQALQTSENAETEISPLRILRLTEGYERLRDNALRYASANGGLPKIWLANFGPPKQHKARADFSYGFLSPGGFLIESGPGAKTVAEAVEAIVAARPLAVVLCSTDDTYPEIVPAFIPALREKLPDVFLILAGYPEDQLDAHRAAGVQEFLHLKRNCLEFNQQLQKTLGVAQ